MSTIQQRISLIIVFIFMGITLLLSSATVVYGDVLFLGDAREAGIVENEVTSEVTSFDADSLFADESTPAKASNPMAILSGVIHKKLNGAGNSIDVVLRDSVNGVSARQNQWPLFLAGLLFLMLVMRLKRRTRKSKFS